MKDREGYIKGGDKREGGLIIDLDQTQTISRNLCLSVVHAFPPNVSCYHRIYFSFFLNPSLYSFPYQNTGDDDYNMDDDYEDDDDYEGYDDGWLTKGKL